MNILTTLMALRLGLSAQATPTNEPASRQAIDAYVAAKMRSAHIPGVALVIVEGDRVVFMKGYGRADPSGRPVTPQTPFLIGSITKSITAIAVMQLVDAREVDLDAPVQRYLPWFRLADPRASAQITVRQLLTMTSGIPQSYETQRWIEEDDGALERVVRSLATAEPTGPPGRVFGYSNANYETLGMIVQAVAGQSYEDYVKAHILTPLEMRQSFVSQRAALRSGMASGYRWWFGIPVAVTLPFHRAELPAGYVIASAEDMSHLLIAEMNDGRYRATTVLSPEGMAVRHREPAATSYGIGWEFLHSNGRTLINHDGGTANFQTSLFIDVGAKVGVFIAANAINALDAFASPHGSSVLDGQTTRAMAHTILNLATNQPLPDTGPGHERLTAIFNLVIAALTIALIASLGRMPGRLARLSRRGIATRGELLWRSGLTVFLNLTLPIVLLFVSLRVAAWSVLVEFQPDLGYWLDGVAIVLFVKGSLELIAVWRAFNRTRSAGASDARFA